MKQFNIKTSKELVQTLTKKLGLREENHIARIALTYSLAKGRKNIGEEPYKYEQYKEYKDNTLFGNYKSYYIALICQKYQLHKDDETIKAHLKWHIDNGLEMIHKCFEENPNLSGTEFLLDEIELGVEAIGESAGGFDFVQNKRAVHSKECYIAPIEILLGHHNGEKVIFTPNNTDLYSNCHIAVAGQSGSGKSYFARRILERLTEKSEGKVNFLYLDFKGVKEEDVSNSDYQEFFHKTNAKLIDAPKDTFPVNPLSFINIANEKDRIVGINRFVDIIVKFANLGSLQKQHLKDATTQAFNNRKDGTYPSLLEIKENIYEMIGDKPSSLTEIMVGLTEIDLFESSKNSEFINDNYYFSVSGDLSNEVKLTGTFLVVYYLYNIFMNMEKAPIENNIAGLRYVLLIDEAHSVFKERKSKEILEKLLREVRSQGVAIMLVSQGIDEFNQPEFDFSELCNSAFLMLIKDNNNWRSLSKFLGVGDKQRNKINRAMEALKPRQAISNIRELEIGDVFNTG
jgi:DNA sulfur modification protein DndE